MLVYPPRVASHLTICVEYRVEESSVCFHETQTHVEPPGLYQLSGTNVLDLGPRLIEAVCEYPNVFTHSVQELD